RCLAGDANPTGGKYGARYSGGDEATEHPDTSRQIGGGRFFVNATGIFTRSLGAARFHPLPSPGRLSEAPRRSRAAGWSADRSMAGQMGPPGIRCLARTAGLPRYVVVNPDIM